MSRHSRTTPSASMKRPQNKEAAQRLAQVMAHQPADEEEEDDDLYDFDSGIPSTGIGLAGGRQARNRSPLVRSLHTCVHIWHAIASICRNYMHSICATFMRSSEIIGEFII